VNENSKILRLRDCMASAEGWGRAQGRVVYQKLIGFVESNPGVSVFRVSLDGVRRVDISFASETVVELSRRYRQAKGFCFFDLTDPDMLENWEAAAQRKGQPICVWNDKDARIIGLEPSRGSSSALRFAMDRPAVRAADFAAATQGMSIANASTKFKQLWEHGFLLRREQAAESGGVEFVYYRIG
jgi:hypothetical protein